MPESRAYWKGQLRLTLVSIPVEVHSATRSATRLQFNQIHEPTGQRVRYEKVVPGIGPVDRDEIIRGYQYEKGEYVLLADDELDAVKLESRQTLELTQFVGACEIDPIYFDRPFFVVPQDELAEDAYRVLRDALRETEKVGLGQFAVRGREYVAAVKPCGNGLLLETLRFEDEIRKSNAFFAAIGKSQADDELLDLAKELIERKSAPFDAAAFKDNYTQALRALIERKLKSRGRKITAREKSEPAPASNVVDLMAALKQSLEGKPKPGKASRSTSRARKSTGRGAQRKSA